MSTKPQANNSVIKLQLLLATQKNEEQVDDLIFDLLKKEGYTIHTLFDSIVNLEVGNRDKRLLTNSLLYNILENDIMEEEMEGEAITTIEKVLEVIKFAESINSDYVDNLTKKIFNQVIENHLDRMNEDGECVVSDNSYCDSDTGYNTVSDVEYSKEYEEIEGFLNVFKF